MLNIRFFLYFLFFLSLLFSSIQAREELTFFPRYGYTPQEQTAKGVFHQVASVYAMSWMVYPITQPDVVAKEGSVTRYKKNFGKIVFDKDGPFWNWFVHPISGSQLYLIYRAFGHTPFNSFALSVLSSTLFEFTIEIYTEPASLQDLVQTPFIGSALGVLLEHSSMALLNQSSSFSRFFGHLLNPATLLPFYQEKHVQLIPILKKDSAENNAWTSGLKLSWSF